MITSFIHFQDLHLRSIEAHSYQDGIKPRTDVFKFSEISNNLADSSNIFIMIPSQLFGFMKYENHLGHKGEILKANALIQVEEQLISDISSLHFFYNADLQLASWIESNIFETIVQNINELDAEVTIIPEHFLLQDQEEIILIRDNTFIVSFSNHSGFGGNLDILHDYLETLDSNIFNASDFLLLADATSAAKYFPQHKKVKQKYLPDIHRGFLQHETASTWNLFQRKWSFKFFKSKIKLSSIESSLIAASVLMILIAPLMINAVLAASITSYKESTMNVFRQLNPGLTRLVNPKAQIDDLTRDIPILISVEPKNLEALAYIETLADESIKRIEFDLVNKNIKAMVERLPSYKLDFIKAGLKTNNLTMNIKDLVESSDGFHGLIVINYDAE